MRIFLAGVSCVGKTTIGAQLATLLECCFFDLDFETERFFETSIERLRNRYLTSQFPARGVTSLEMRTFSRGQLRLRNCVAAERTAGWLLEGCQRNAAIVVLRDTPENILRRIRLYDIDSRPLHKRLTDRERSFYLREIGRDNAYFNRFYRRAHVSVDIAVCGPNEASRKVRDSLTAAPLKNPREASDRHSARMQVQINSSSNR